MPVMCFQGVHTTTTYFKVRDVSVPVPHPAHTFVSAIGGCGTDALPFFGSYFSMLPATMVAGEASGPVFLPLPGDRAILFVRPMYYNVHGYDDGDAGHCQILLYADSQFTDITETCIPDVATMSFSDSLFPPWLDMGFLDTASSNVKELQV